MDKQKLEIPQSGIYVRGVVVSNTASAFQKKDGSGVVVRLTHELALQPGMATLERFVTPAEDPSIKLDGLNVTDFQKFKEFETVTVKANRLRADKERIVISSWDLAA